MRQTYTRAPEERMRRAKPQGANRKCVRAHQCEENHKLLNHPGPRRFWCATVVYNSKHHPSASPPFNGAFCVRASVCTMNLGNFGTQSTARIRTHLQRSLPFGAQNHIDFHLVQKTHLPGLAHESTFVSQANEHHQCNEEGTTTLDTDRERARSVECIPRQ